MYIKTSTVITKMKGWWKLIAAFIALSTMYWQFTSTNMNKEDTLFRIHRSKDSKINKMITLNNTTEASQPKLKIMTWNIQGLKEDELEKRIQAVILEIKMAYPDVVFLQELVSISYLEICKAFRVTHECVRGRRNMRSDHFIGILYKRKRFRLEDRTIIPFKNSVLHRLLLVVKLYVIGPVSTRLVLMTSHLESSPEFKNLRAEQFKQSFQIGKTFPEDFNVIFGGDLNLEEGEELDTVPADFKDLWRECGSPESSKYTWDYTQNHNDLVRFLNFPVSGSSMSLKEGMEPMERYDRLYFRSSNPKSMHLISLELLGKEQVEGTKYFPSDHWALISTFQLSVDETQKISCKNNL